MIRQPASVIIAGPSGSGKSDLLEQLLKEKEYFFPSQRDRLLLRPLATHEKTIQSAILQRTPSRRSLSQMV